MFKTIILTCSQQLKDERTDQAIFHILQGKKSIQTIQDIYLYKLDSYYKILPSLDQTIYNQTIQELARNELMQPSDAYKNSYTISSKGNELLEQSTLPSVVSYLDGKKYSVFVDAFEQRLFLFIQALSNKQYQQNAYVPIVDRHAIMRDIKVLFSTFQMNSKTLAKNLYEEIKVVLETLDHSDAEVFVSRLSGFEHYGKSIQQIARDMQIPEVDTRILLQSIVHYLLKTIDENKHQFPILEALKMQEDLLHLTQSANKTKKLVDQGMSLQKLAQVRHLKMNTIYDHIVEIAIHDDSFDIHEYIDSETMTTILRMAQTLDTYQLKELKEALGKDYSYFHIRLALARGGAING